MQQLPSFIGGFRSGTTLLINLLGMHTTLVPWFETKELCELLRWFRVHLHPGEREFEAAYAAPAEPRGFGIDATHARMTWHMQATAARLSGAQASGKAAHERYPLGNDYVRYPADLAARLLDDWRGACRGATTSGQVEDACRTLLLSLASAQTDGAPSSVWVNKTPEISRFAAELRHLLGPCRVIYMVRNGLDVVASASRLGWGGTEALAYNWKGLLERTRDAMRGHEAHYLELRYESLLADPARMLDEVFAFLGVAPEGRRIEQAFRERYGAGAFERPAVAVPPLPVAEHARFMAVAGDLQEALGYTNAEAGPG